MMAINIQHTYSTYVDIHYYSEDGQTLHSHDCGSMDDIAERICKVLVKHNFSYAKAYSTRTGEVLMTMERI